MTFGLTPLMAIALYECLMAGALSCFAILCHSAVKDCACHSMPFYPKNAELKFRIFRCSWERYYIAYITHTRYEEQKTLETESKARVRC